jgi:tryptophan halogenase
MVDMVPDDDALGFLRDIEEVIADSAEQMPTHAQFIDRFCPAPPLVS